MKPSSPATAGRAALVALALLVTGAVVVRAVGDPGTGDLTARIENGNPRGLLALHLFLSARGVDVSARRLFSEPEPTAAGSVVVIPPPERTAWDERETAAVLAAADAGAHVVVLCDDEPARNQRLRLLLDALAVSCRVPQATAERFVEKTARGAFPAYAAELFVRGAGRVVTDATARAIPAWVVDDDVDGAAVVSRARRGRGLVTVLGTATVLQNDGLGRADNAAFLLWLVGDAARVVVDQRHHRSRATATFAQAALRGPGPPTALLALALLVPLSLLSLLPRRGEPPQPATSRAPFTTAARVRALAALLWTVERQSRRRRGRRGRDKP